MDAFNKGDWTTESLQEIWEVISRVAKEEFKLDFYNPYLEVVTFEEMLQIYTTSFPIMFNHWTFGKNYEELYKQYKHNRASIAYEVIFNTDPALCYLLETNSSIMQALVLCHAAVGHSAFFKNNEFIKQNTNAKTIIPFLKNMRTYVAECEEKYGNAAVEKILDFCKSLELYSTDRSEVIETSRKVKEQKRIKRKEEQEKDFDMKVAALITDHEPVSEEFTRLKEQNIVKYIAKNSPILKQWERELMLMFCKVQQYFYPQMHTKLMNEGYATFWHYQLMNRLYELGYINEGGVLEFLQSHTGVCCQHDHDSPYYHGINVYKLGFELFSEIKRICENPTDEDKHFFPGLIGKNWIDEVNFAAENFKDESFVLQYLTPKLVRDLKLFKYKDDTMEDFWEINAVNDDEGFKDIRKQLANQYNFSNKIPYIYVEGSDLRKSRTLYISAKKVNEKDEHDELCFRTLKKIKTVWPYPIVLKGYDEDNKLCWKGEVPNE